ncbi:MAG: NAD-dependent epimerase/dehydratase family protein [Candidatus Omnitrophica bacterium]|jgi:nucleoside-diphosphate-sugar epimerase|nr:NAD-dependent epimerase/dehydratase family protein [Candidatus Omnitrophota bacterium]MDD5660355.1 NAD-dependent epimerase/dehydratase family protein [Candidatus Omnitrophota bacterium]
MNKVFVTGANGFIGSALCVKMLENGYRLKAAFRGKVNPFGLLAGIEAVCMESIETCDKYYQDLEGVDTVIHLAACAHMDKGISGTSLEDFRKVNVLGTERLARMAIKAKVKRFIFISSVKVHGEGGLRSYTEKDALMPEDAYGISKMEAEAVLVSLASGTGLQTVILRPPLVYGPGVKANFKSLIKIASSGMPLPFKGINNRRSFIYLDNLVDAIITCVEHPLAAGEVFMVSDGEDISTPFLMEMIATAMNKKRVLFSLHPVLLRVLCNIAGKGRDMGKLAGSLVVDSSKIRNRLGWKPPFTVKEGIKETVKYYKP